MSDFYKLVFCNFCQRTAKKVKYLIAGPNLPMTGSTHICDQCIDVAHELVEEKKAEDAKKEKGKL